MDINGKPVVDATEHMVVEITKEDCEKGKNKNPSACAAARAILREYKVKSARVHVGITYIEEDKRWIRYKTPHSLRTELVAFDRGGTFEPGIYTLCPPTSGMRLSELKKRNLPKLPPEAHRGKTTRLRHETTNIRPRGANR
jgi:hypothetical protein